MYGHHCTMAWIKCLKTFLDAAEAHKSSKGFTFCPCCICRNKKEFSKRHTLHVPLPETGFMDNYTLQTKQGESGVPMEGDEGDNYDDNNIANWAYLYQCL